MNLDVDYIEKNTDIRYLVEEGEKILMIQVSLQWALKILI